MAERVGAGDYRYEEVEDWAKIEMVGSASDMATDSEDRVYVADCVDHVVRKYATSGEQLQVLGSPGQPGLTDGPFNQPTCVVHSAYSGEIFVSDGYRQNRIHRFSNDGDIRLSWGQGDRNQFDWEVSGVGEPLTGPG